MHQVEPLAFGVGLIPVGTWSPAKYYARFTD
jgi:hypothetical protein